MRSTAARQDLWGMRSLLPFTHQEDCQNTMRMGSLSPTLTESTTTRETVAWISPKMGERQRRRHVSASSGSEPCAKHAVCRTIKPCLSQNFFLTFTLNYITLSTLSYCMTMRQHLSTFDRLLWIDIKGEQAWQKINTFSL